MKTLICDIETELKEVSTTKSIKEESYIQTYTGKKFFPFSPSYKDIDIEDIAHALSNICRYSGHCKKFYSVAQHSYLVSKKCSKENAMWGLLHDASEIYSGGDIPTPIKHHMLDLKRLEENVMYEIAKKFTLPYPIPEEVHFADKQLFLLEWSAIMSNNNKENTKKFPI